MLADATVLPSRGEHPASSRPRTPCKVRTPDDLRKTSTQGRNQRYCRPSNNNIPIANVNECQPYLRLVGLWG
jgi:hypothetical protein